MRKAGRVVAAVLQTMAAAVRPGLKTRELDEICVKELRKYNAIPSFKGYRGFPANLCVSVNDEIVHGIPGNRVLQEGDIVSLDVGAIVNGLHGDAAITIGVGEISPEAQKLLEVTKGALMAGIAVAYPGNRLGDISAEIQAYVESRGFSVVREYTGHGIGYSMHEDPLIPNFGRRGHGILLAKGMTFALEPMANIGGWQTKVSSDNWTVLTADGSLSAHFEHDIAITDKGALILSEMD